MNPHRVFHDFLHNVAVIGSMITVWGAINAQTIQFFFGVVLGIGSLLWSWYLQQTGKTADENRRRETLAADEKRRQEILDADARRDREWKDFELKINMALKQQQAGVKVE